MTARTRKTRSSARPRVGKYIFIMFFVMALAMAVALVSAGITMAREWLSDLPDYSDADAYLLAEPTTMLDADGNVIAEYYDENRTPVTIDQVSEYLIEATIDIEDERFYTHNGVDMQGILRAVVVQLVGGSQGASTITQQVVRNTVLKNERFEQTISRKVREAYIAMELEKMYSKDEILMMYLNTIFYGAGCYGVQAAAETYFGKNASELTLVEAATIAGLPQSPTSYNPTTNPDLAVERRNLVLGNMLRLGDITQEEYDAAVATTLQLNVTQRAASGAFEYPYFVAWVRTQLQEQFSDDTIFKGGLTIKTTIDPDIQAAAESARDSVLIGPDYSNVNAALVAIDPDTGYVRAMVGGWGYDYSEWNLATQAKRQPGSSFKVFTLTAAIQAGMNPNILLDSNNNIQVGDWVVTNVDDGNWGTITLRQATLWSSNTAYAQVIHELGASTVVSLAHSMGITSELVEYDSLTLGTSECTVLEMANAYATLASGGVYREATGITEVLDRNGNVIYSADTTGTQVITDSVAKAVTDILEGVISDTSVSGRTGAQAALAVDQPAAGKTGTTNDKADLWFCGYTPQYAVAVWVGTDTRDTIYLNGVEGTNNSLSIPIWKNFLDTVLAGLPREEWSFANAADPTYQSNSVWSISKGTGSTSSTYTTYTDTTYTDTSYTDTSYTDVSTDVSYTDTTYTDVTYEDTYVDTYVDDGGGGGDTGGGDYTVTSPDG